MVQTTLILFKKHWPIILILLIAVFCRFYRLSEYMEFLGDQGRDVVIVRDFLLHGNLFFIGPQTSIGNMYLSPYYYYFIAPSLLFALFNPVGPAAFVALLGVLTVCLLYRISSIWFSPRVGLISALLLALSPVVIKYSSFSWNPNIMPLFALLFIYFLTRRRYIFASLAFIFCLSSHYLALLLLFPAIFILFLNKPIKNEYKNILLSILIFLLSFTPQILFDIKHRGQNIGAMFTFFSQRETTVNLKAYKALPKLPEMFTEVTTRLLAGKSETAGIYVSIVFFSLLVLLLLKNKFKPQPRSNYYLCLIWFSSGLFGLALYKQHIYDHYFGFLYPVMFILAALCLDRLGKIWGNLLLIFLVILSLIQNPFRWPPPRQLQTTETIVSSIIQSSGGAPFNFALLAKLNYDPGYLYLLTRQPVAYFHLNDRLTDQLFVVCEPFQIDCSPINNPEWGIAAFGWAKIDSQWEINGIKVYRLIHNPDGQKS